MLSPYVIEEIRGTQVEELIQDITNRDPVRMDTILSAADNPRVYSSVYRAALVLVKAMDDAAKRGDGTPDSTAAIRPHWWREIGVLMLPVLRECTDLNVLWLAVLARLAPSATQSIVTWQMQARSFVHAAVWAQNNFPAVHLTAVQACALALSDLTQEQLLALQPPWPTFMLLSDDAFVAEDATVEYAFVSKWHVPTSVMKTFWNVSTFFSEGSTLDRSASDSVRVFNEPDKDLTWDETDASKGRAALMMQRTALNVCEVLSSGEGSLRRRAVRKKPGGKKVVTKGQGLAYELGLPVRVDMRSHISDYLSSDIDRVYKVRWVVRGHFRNQACGSGLAQRRRTWIQPYWKGPEKGTRLVREHQVTDAVVGLSDEVKECPTTSTTTPEVGVATPSAEQR